MSKISLVILLIITGFVSRAQSAKERNMLQLLKSYKIRYGIKAGYNSSQLTNSKTDFYSSARNGFTISGFIEPPSDKTGFGFRSEIVFSRQGFSIAKNGYKQAVTQDYVYLPELVTYNFGKWAQIQAGLQVGYLLKADIAKNNKSGQNILPFYNRLDYGFTGGTEFSPGEGFIIAARYTCGFRKVFKDGQTNMLPVPGTFNPAGAKGRNSVMQVMIGYKI